LDVYVDGYFRRLRKKFRKGLHSITGFSRALRSDDLAQEFARLAALPRHAPQQGGQLTEVALKQFLADPDRFASGTSMPLRRLDPSADRRGCRHAESALTKPPTVRR
jgi:hypothetical protein